MTYDPASANPLAGNPLETREDMIVVDVDGPQRPTAREVVERGTVISAAEGGWPCGDTVATGPRGPREYRLGPYSGWGERAAGTMRVWLPVAG